MNVIARKLYTGDWESSMTLAKSLVPSPEMATEIAQQLAKSGWREKVAASEADRGIQAPPAHPRFQIIATFAANPRSYTCDAFSRMLTTVRRRGALADLEGMKRACPDSDYGQQLKDH